MRALTVQQPWAWAIFNGKDIENRTQLWSYRGPLAIHAGARLSERGMRVVPDILAAERGTSPTLVREQLCESIELGKILGVVDLVDVHHAEPHCCESWWAEQSYIEHGGHERRQLVHLMLDRPREFATPIPATGRLGLWTPDADLLAEINHQLEAT